jgi:precorrin-2 dehydrogenase/sirohydrochlorin ferrochelatase
MAQPGYSPYPIVLTQLDSVLCVVIGGGEVALRKVSALLESGAHVKVVSPMLHPQLAEWHVDQRFEYAGRPYAPGDLQGAFLAIAATDRQEVNASVAAEARQRGILLNVADDPDAGNFYAMGAVTRGDVLLAVSTGGDSPALSAHIRCKLEATFGPEYGVLAKRLGELRRDVVNTLPRAARTQLWRALTTDEVLGWLRDGDHARFEAYVQTLVEEQAQSASSGK